MEDYQDNTYYEEPVSGKPRKIPRKRRRHGCGCNCFTCGCIVPIILIVGFLIASYVVGSNMPAEPTPEEQEQNLQIDTSFINEQIQQLRERFNI